MKIASVGIEDGHLMLPGPDHARMTMTDVGDVVVSVEIFLALIVIQVLHGTTNDFDRVLVSDAQVMSKQSLASCECVGFAQCSR